MQKLMLVLLFIGVVTVGKSTPIFAADQSHTPNPKLDSAQPEQTTPPASVPQEPRGDQRAPTVPAAQKEQEQKEKHYAKDLTLANCEPPPESPLSASPLASETVPTVEEQQK